MRTSSACSHCTTASLQAVRYAVKHVKKARHVRACNQPSANSGYTASQEWKDANPGFDEIELDEDYYQSLGISKEELADQLAFLASDADPMGEDLGPEGLDNQQLGASSYLMDEDMSEATWGPQAILLAGFKAEECAIIRCILDSAGSDLVKVIPCTSDMQYLSVEIGMNEPEVDWSQPRPEHWGRGREWGSQRVILFSGLSGGAVLTIVELLEEAGLPPLCIALAEETDADRVIGEVLAETVKAQRGRKTPKKHVWEVPGHAGRHLPDLEELIGSQARERTQVMQDELQQKQQQFNEESVSSSTQSQTAAEPLQADPKTDSSSHTPEIQSSVPGATETASQLQQEQSSTAAHSTSEHLTNAPGSPDPEEPGAMSAEDLRASQHTQAMEPGIEALRKRRAALQQHSSPGDGESLSEQHAHQMSEHRAAEEQDDAAAASTAEPGLLDETLPAAAQTAVNLHAPRSTPAAPLQGQQTRTSQNQPLDAGSQTAQTLRTEIPGSSQAAGIGGHHADDISGVFSSAEERQLTGAEPSNTQDDYDSLLDAIAAGNFDWEPPGQQSPSIQASEQQPSINQPRQPSLQSQQAAADQTNSQQQAWPEQVEAMPSVPADMPLEEHAAGGAGPDEQAVTSSHPTDMPASGHHQTTRQSSQQPAEAQPSQDPVSSEQGRQSAEAAEQAWPWDSSKAADTPTLAADVVARSNSRLRLRRASPSLQPQKQAGRTQPAGKPEPAGRSRTLSDLLKSKRRSGQGTMQETEWRVTDSQQMTAKEFVKPPVDIDSQRPVWAASAASAAGVGADAEAAKHEDGNQQSGPPSESRPLTKQELRALAARRGLDYQRLLADALSRGIPVSD